MALGAAMTAAVKFHVWIFNASIHKSVRAISTRTDFSPVRFFWKVFAIFRMYLMQTMLVFIVVEVVN